MAPITSEGGASSQDGNGRKWGTKKAQESTSAGGNCRDLHRRQLPSPPGSQYSLHRPCFVVGQERYWLESSLPGWLVSSTWVFLGLERNRYSVWCRQPAQGVARNLLTKCYNFFTMPRRTLRQIWPIRGESHNMLTNHSRGAHCLPTGKRKREDWR